MKSEEVWFKVCEAAGVRFRGRALSREEFFPTFGQGTAADIPVFGFDCTVAELDAFYVDQFVRHLDAMWVNPEARPLLERLKGEGVKLALVTNTVSPLAAQILTRAELGGLFGSLATADRVAHAKPSPLLVQLACHELGVQPGEAWMVGDSRFDRQAARGAGVFFVGLGIDGDRRVEALSAL